MSSKEEKKEKASTDEEVESKVIGATLAKRLVKIPPTSQDGLCITASVSQAIYPGLTIQPRLLAPVCEALPGSLQGRPHLVPGLLRAHRVPRVLASLVEDVSKIGPEVSTCILAEVMLKLTPISITKLPDRKG